VLLLNTDRETAVEIEPGDRIAQLVIVRHELPTLVEVDELADTHRGGGGFGSSG
jgi:dUTP pyrophosphatase